MNRTSPPPWLTKLSATLYFGPRPKTPEDVAYLTQHLRLRLFVNASRNDAVDKYSGEPVRTAYVRDYGKRYKFTSVNVSLSAEAFDHAKGAQALLHGVRAMRSLLDTDDVVNRGLYIHAETGLADEAYIALLLWRMLAPTEAPRDVEAWLRDNHKEALFDDDADKRGLLIAAWKLLDAEDDKRAKMSMFGVVVKRAKTGE